MTPEEQARKMSQIIAKAWIDKEFKQKLLADATKKLREEGLDIAPGIEVKLVEDTNKVRHLVLPLKPSGHQLTEEQLESVAAGKKTVTGCYCTLCCCGGPDLLAPLV